MKFTEFHEGLVRSIPNIVNKIKKFISTGNFQDHTALCHKNTAKYILDTDHELKDLDVKLFGSPRTNEVHHSTVVDKENNIKVPEDLGSLDDAGWTLGSKETVPLLKTMSVEEFIE